MAMLWRLFYWPRIPLENSVIDAGFVSELHISKAVRAAWGTHEQLLSVYGKVSKFTEELMGIIQISTLNAVASVMLM